MNPLVERIAGLSREKRALLTRRNPLSFSQQRLWFLDQLESGSPFYNIPLVVQLDGDLEPSLLARVFSEILRRHEVLRTLFPAFDGEPLQVVLPAEPVRLSRVDLGGLPERRRRAEADRLSAAEVRRPFDLARDLPLRIALLAESPRSHRMVLTLHHIVADGWSFDVLIREIAALYQAFARGERAPLPEPALQYGDFARWQRERLQGEAVERLVAWWRERLAGSPTALELPADFPRPALPTFRGRSIAAELTMPTTAFADLMRTASVSLFMLLLAAFQMLLARWSGQDDVSVGSPMVHRDRVELEGLIGLFHNTLVLRSDLSGDPSFRELLARVREAVLSAHAHQELPFERLVDELQPERALNRHPIFQTMFTLKVVPPRGVRFAGLTVTPVPAEKGAAKFDLTLSIFERGERLAAVLEYNADLFRPATAARLLGQYETLLRGIAAQPDRRISELPLMAEAERHQLLVEWNDTAAGGEPACLHALVERQAALRPAALAVASEEGALSYGELNARANRLARHLRRLGVGPETLVGICLRRDVDLPVAVLATLKAGGAYLPLDPSFPRERLALMVEDSGAALVVSAGDAFGDLGAGVRAVLLDAHGEAIRREDGGDLPAAADPDGLAYVLYTSGSTGRPKGVMVPHRGVVGFLRFMARELGAGPEDALLAVTTLSFDISVLELFLPLATGGRVELAGRETAVDGSALLARLVGSRATLMQATPATWQMLVEAGWAGGEGLRALCGGEAFPPALASDLLARCGVLWNVYGPTETTIWSTLHRFREVTGSVPLGRPLADTRVTLAGPRGEPVPAGVPGELLIGGAGVARGYLGRPALTAERFVPDPLAAVPGGRAYRTGDLVRRRPDGALEFLGRLDQQVKVRGYRVEPGEVEARLLEHPGVREAAVAARSGERGHAILAAWFAAAVEAPPSVAELRAFLREVVPEYMVPSAFTRLEALPRTPNGKIDRRSLPDPDPARARSGAAGAPAVSPTQEVVAGVWCEVLGLADVGVDESFFDLGGHSLLATQVVSRLRSIFRIDLSLRSLFEAPTVAGLSVRVDACGEGGLQSGAPPLRATPRGAEVELSLSQQRLWVVDQLAPGRSHYNLSIALHLTGPLAPAPLERALSEVVRRHESLRTSFPAPGGRPVQRIAPPAPAHLPLVDLGGLPEPLREPEAKRLIQTISRRPFDLAAGPLLRTLLVRSAPEEHAFGLAMHHIVGDRWSLGILVRELAHLYGAFSRDEPSPLPEPTLQYADFSEWHRRRLEAGLLERQLAYWRKALAGCPPFLMLPTDRPRPPVQGLRGGRHLFALDAEACGALKGLARSEAATFFMVLFAAFAVFLHRLTGQEDFVVGANVANRNAVETEGLVGFFANLLPLRAEVSGGASFREVLGRVRETALEAYAHQDVPFDRLVEELQPKRDPSRTPLVQVVFSLQNVPAPRALAPGLGLRPLRSSPGTAKFDLVLDLVERDGALEGVLEYDRDLFRPTTAARTAEHYAALLAAAAARPDASVAQLQAELDERERRHREREAQRFESEDARFLRGLRGRRAMAVRAEPGQITKERV